MGWRVLGLRHRERILPVGALVTVIGELAQSDAGGGGGPAFEGCVPSGKGRVLVLQVGYSPSVAGLISVDASTFHHQCSRHLSCQMLCVLPLLLQRPN